MSAPLTCATVEELAAELALGHLSGVERAGVLDHLAGCANCRSVVEELSEVADGLLLLAPEDEPPAGFESRVLARLPETRLEADALTQLPSRTAARARRRRLVGRRPMLAVFASAAVLVALGLGGLAGAGVMRRADHRALVRNKEYADALLHVGGRSLRSGVLFDAKGTRVGQAFIYDGSQSWVFVSVDNAGKTGTYTVVCTGKRAGPLSWPGLQVADGHGTIAWTADGSVRGLDYVSVVDPGGHQMYSAKLDPSVA